MSDSVPYFSLSYGMFWFSSPRTACCQPPFAFSHLPRPYASFAPCSLVMSYISVFYHMWHSKDQICTSAYLPTISNISLYLTRNLCDP
ncbi:hypothetical protein BDV37DRAFT_73304 [Aspergillus pseudonomiae]|uniref:Uncharacterized protein n=1 Tax=Aspergillus pseudonomiae TaxID=1506151 RepID=A0A5N7DI85_9EURO|nr:uncharacterized protein BDV37DRAFT_73304 [Aspergillus pseudonomiae]KAE8406044.1 hypothetical protein BDV37DRAFT_73304 [Aspergillus pseudonomiae]